MSKAGVYSLRLAVAGYSGSAVAVRRDSDNAIQDIGFDGTAENSGLDTVALATFLSGANGYVSAWYDQTGNARHLTQATTTAQPRIITSSGMPYLVFDGTDDRMATSGGAFTQQAVAAIATYDEGANFVNYPGLAGVATGLAQGITGNNGTTNLLEGIAGLETWVNGVKTFAVNLLSDQNWYYAQAPASASAEFVVGQERATASRFWGGKVYEVYAFDAQQTNAERVALDGNVSDYYSLGLQPTKQVYIFLGQSNMFGADALIAGTGATTLSGAGLQEQPDTEALFSSDNGASGTDIYGIGAINGHDDTTGDFIHGPEVGFIRTLDANGVDASSVYIIKITANYSALESSRSAWVKGNSLYTMLSAAITQRLAELEALGFRYEVQGFAWAQGIDDGILGRTQLAYETDLRDIIQNLRADYGNERFIISRSVDSQIATSAKMLPIRLGQVAVAESTQDCDWVNLDDLTPFVNTHHLSSANQIIHGNRIAQAMLQIVPSDDDIFDLLTALDLKIDSLTAAVATLQAEVNKVPRAAAAITAGGNITRTKQSASSTVLVETLS